MKLGLCYMVFDGFELLKFAIQPIREVIDHISITYQSISYFGNEAEDNLLSSLDDLKKQGLIDEIIHYEPNLNIHHKENELILRNIGLEASKKANCTHHISADVDEFYKKNELNNAKNIMFNENYDFSIAMPSTYYKSPNYLIVPEMDHPILFIHSTNNNYEMNKSFPFRVEITRRLATYNQCKIFPRNEIVIHHMSYVRKNIKRKLENSDNGRFYDINKFVKEFNKYQLGSRLIITPDFLTRRTTFVPNVFNIEI